MFDLVLNRCVPTVVGNLVTDLGERLQSADETNITAADVEEGSL